MKLYSVCAEVTISVTCRVRARSKAEAKRKAMQLPMESPSSSGAWISSELTETDEWSAGGELDGEPSIIEVKELP